MAEAPFSADWLALREPVDHRSRASALLDPLRGWWQERQGARVLDLGAGTGSNVRYLAPRLGRPQRWTLVDHDAALLAHAMRSSTNTAAGVSVACVEGDLAHEGLVRVGDADLVTASALLDLVSEAWLTRLIEACRLAGNAALLALTWDGGIEWRTPSRGVDPDDDLVLEAVRAHQRRDKGLGPALGPTGAAAAEAAFRASGFRTWQRPSPWCLDAGDAELARVLIGGWAEAAAEQRPDSSGRVRDWAERRTKDIDAGPFTLVVGHVDLLALPAER